MKQLSNLIFAFMVLPMIVLQSGCNSDSVNDPHPDVTASNDTIHGIVKYKQTSNSASTLVDWHFGPAIVRATIEGGNIATAALSSDGTFMLILPKTVEGKYFVNMADYSQTLGGSIITSPDALYFTGPIKFVIDYTDNNVAKNIAVNLSVYKLVNNLPVIDRVYTYNFYDQPGSFAGTDYYGNSYNWTFIKGWGKIEAYVTSVSSSVTTSKTVDDVPSDAVWAN